MRRDQWAGSSSGGRPRGGQVDAMSHGRTRDEPAFEAPLTGKIDADSPISTVRTPARGAQHGEAETDQDHTQHVAEGMRDGLHPRSGCHEGEARTRLAREIDPARSGRRTTARQSASPTSATSENTSSQKTRPGQNLPQSVRKPVEGKPREPRGETDCQNRSSGRRHPQRRWLTRCVNRRERGAGLVARLLRLELGHAVGDDAGAGGHLEAAARASRPCGSRSRDRDRCRA